jgi:hypothetical protein
MNLDLGKYCADHVDAFLELAWFLIAAAILVAIASAVIEIVGKLEALYAPKPEPDAGGAVGGIPDALKGLIEALINAPVWFAMFLGGLGLVWVASTSLPGMCRVPAPVQPAATAPPAPPPAGAATNPPRPAAGDESGG